MKMNAQFPLNAQTIDQIWRKKFAFVTAKLKIYGLWCTVIVLY